MSSIALTKKGKWIFGIIAVFILFVFGVIPLLAIVRYSTISPNNCKTCHALEFEQWKSSRGHSPEDAVCVDCHAAPFKVIVENYYADEEKVNQNCIRCHSNMRTLEQEGLKRHIIKISHQVHVEELEIGCLDCHRNHIHDKDVCRTNMVTKRSCYECHQDEIDGTPDEENCLRCHYVILTYEETKNR